MKRIVAGLITVVVFLGVLVFSRGPMPTKDAPRKVAPTAEDPKSPQPPVNAPTKRKKPKEPEPEDCIYRMFDAAQDGDVAAYLDCFTGNERRRLDRELADESRDVYGQSLRDAVSSLKGHAVFGPDEAAAGKRQVELTVERIYATRTERQTYRVVRESDQWRIQSVEAAQAYQPSKPYGTSVFEMPTEE